MPRIRKAVGAIVVCSNEPNKYLLVQKATVWDTKNGKSYSVQPFWDIPKGGLEDSDTNELYAIKRELNEELGTDKFRMLNLIEEELCFDFDKITSDKIGFDKQTTKIYKVKFLGTKKDIKIDKKELTNFDIVNYEVALKMIGHSETRKFFQKYA